ncbi:D-2-hydroxyacid dehydrogenase [Mesobacillus harenae]|uniref:D-2-hydroxyacid dehydrogenase n=1 Tax=Mesobacillus harenae TaxID=2213203 RepID=UPI00157FE2D5|nr:D-2-hydroxyacid dehydrogenase [Mesobacillus harenae]
MKAVSSILPDKQIIDGVKSAFPAIEFEFFKGISEAIPSLKEAEIFITFGEDLTDEIILECKKLRWIMVMSAGLERMPLNLCEDRGILVTNARGIHKVPMAEFTLGIMLHHVKQMGTLLSQQQDQNWNRKIPMGELYGKTLLILGVGAIGGEIARLGKALQMKTIGVNRHGGKVDSSDLVVTLEDFEEALPEADFIVSVLPSTAETRYLLTEDHFQRMKKTAAFINIGRGDVVAEEVLISAMERSEIAHAYLDVFINEPLPSDHKFWTMSNITVTPHISSITKNYLPRSFEIFHHNLHTYINNQSNFINKIEPGRGY